MPDDDQNSATSTLSRRDMFRSYMKAFNPTAPAREMIRAGLVIDELHGSLYRHLAVRADLEPGSQQLLIGGIGSGKTTELLLAETWLRNQEGAASLYIDITGETDLSGFNEGALLAGFGRHLYRYVNAQFAAGSGPQHETVQETRKAIQEFCYGKTETEWVAYADEPPDDWEPDEPETDGYYRTRQVPGKLKPPIPAIRRDLQSIGETLGRLITLVREQKSDVVVIFDGLDRLLAPEKFLAAVYQDFRVLRSLRVSVLATAPISILYGTGQQVSEQFERVHHLAPVATAEPILEAVLRRRCADSSLLNESNAKQLCAYSGGVLRDLITLSRDAGEEAYVSGADAVRDEDVLYSVRQLGTAYLRGLGPDQIAALWSLANTRSINLKLPSILELLVTRRVIEFSSTDFRVHPALLEVLPKPEEGQRD